jgi:hypothetical protein
MRRFLIATLSPILMASCSWALAADNDVDYPTDYRSWQHVKSMIIQPGHPLEDPFGGIHHIYANTKAMAGLSGGNYEDGAFFVFDLLDYDESNMTIVELQHKRLDVMQFDRVRFSGTGGWGYETFVGTSKTQRLEQDVKVACAACHQSAKSSNYVFSKYRP